MGTHLRALSKSLSMNTNMLGYEWFSKNFLHSCALDESSLIIGRVNPFTLTASKTGLTVLEIFYLQKHLLENIWIRNDGQKPYNNSPSVFLWNFAFFPSYFHKYESSWRYFLEELECELDNSCTKCVGRPCIIHDQLPPSFLGMDAWMTWQLNVVMIRKLRGLLTCLANFFHILSTSSLLVQELNFCAPIHACSAQNHLTILRISL